MEESGPEGTDAEELEEKEEDKELSPPVHIANTPLEACLCH